MHTRYIPRSTLIWFNQLWGLENSKVKLYIIDYIDKKIVTRSINNNKRGGAAEGVSQYTNTTMINANTTNQSNILNTSAGQTGQSSSG